MWNAAIANVAAIGFPKAQQEACKCSLARAALTNECRMLAASNRERQLVHNGNGGMVAKAETICCDQRGVLPVCGSGWQCTCCGTFRSCRQDRLCRAHGFHRAEARGRQGTVLAEYGFEDEHPDGVLHARQSTVCNVRQQEDNHSDPDRDPQDIEQGEETLAFRAFVILAALKILRCPIELSLCP